MKIVKTRMAKPNQRNEGIWVTFDRLVALHGGIATREWFISWSKLSQMIEGHIKRIKV